MVNEKELALIIITGMIFSLTMVLSMVSLSRKNRKIQELGNKLLEEEKSKKELEKMSVAISTQESERSKIARLLHDEVGALLTIVHKNLLLAQSKLT